jgi:hypothetical protein
VPTGGLADGIDVAACLALGATAASLPWQRDPRAVIRELREAVWVTGAEAASGLTPGHLRHA